MSASEAVRIGCTQRLTYSKQRYEVVDKAADRSQYRVHDEGFPRQTVLRLEQHHPL